MPLKILAALRSIDLQLKGTATTTGRCVLLVAVVGLLSAAGMASPIIYTFEGLPDGPLSKIDDAKFADAVVLTAGISLNDEEFPSHSGVAVLGDDGGPITITFGSPVTAVGAYVTYAVPAFLRAFDISGRQITVVRSTFASNLASSGDPGSSPNEFMEVRSSGSISSVVFAGGPTGDSLAIDDLTVSAVPESASWMLFAAGLLALRFWRSFGPLRAVSTQCVIRRAALFSLLIALVLNGQDVGQTYVSPSVAGVSQSTLVTVTAKIAAPPVGQVQSVNLVRYDQNGLNAVVVGQMYDDQTHGDVKAGDGIYTGQVTVAESTPTVLFFRASVAFRGQPKRLLSAPAVLLIQDIGTATGALTALAHEISTGDIDNALMRFSPSPLNRDVLSRLTPGERQKFADALTHAVIVGSDANLEILELSWQLTDGRVVHPRVTLAQDPTGQWVVASW